MPTEIGEPGTLVRLCIFCKEEMKIGIIIDYKEEKIYICKSCLDAFKSGKYKLVK